MKKSWALAALSVSLIAFSAHAADDPQVGHWKMNSAKSKYVSSPAPKTSEVTVTPDGKDGVALDVHQITQSGQPLHIQYSAQYDGKPYARAEAGAGALGGQTVTLKRVAPRTAERELHLGGKSIGIERWTISADGKTRTVTQFGTDVDGKKIDNRQVYDRQ